MRFEPALFLFPSWAAFLAYWAVAARGVKRPRVRQPVAQRVLTWLVVIVSGALLAWGAGRRIPDPALEGWRAAPAVGWAGVVLCAAGIAFAIWARRVLAGNWSAEVQIKHGHELVTTGPYRFARHPIYTGIFTALIGTWMTLGTPIGLLAILVAFLGLWHKMTLEERFMREQFPDAYPAYAARVKRLIPGVF